MSNRFLILLSSSKAYLPAIKYLHKKFSVDSIDVLITQKTTVYPKDHEIVERVWELEQDYFHPDKLDAELKSKLQKQNYKYVIVLCNDIYRLGYENVEKTAKEISEKNTFAIDGKQNIRSTSNLIKTLLKVRPYILKCLHFLFFIIQVILLLFGFLFVEIPIFLFKKIKAILISMTS